MFRSLYSGVSGMSAQITFQVAFDAGGMVVVTTTSDWRDVGMVLADVRDPRKPDAQLAALAAALTLGLQNALQAFRIMLQIGAGTGLFGPTPRRSRTT